MRSGKVLFAGLGWNGLLKAYYYLADVGDRIIDLKGTKLLKVEVVMIYFL